MTNLRLLQKFVRVGFVVSTLCIGGFVATMAAHAESLDSAKCKALETEHATLLTDNVKADLEKGPEWAKANLGELRLQKIKRLIEIEERIAFQCRTTPLRTAVVIPSLAEVKPATKQNVKANTAQIKNGALRASRVPPPVRRPQLQLSKPVPPTGTPGATGAINSAKPSSESGANTKATLPKVIRLQPAQSAKTVKSQTRRVRKKPRRKVRRAADAYVPPPPGPGYQPSLTSP